MALYYLKIFLRPHWGFLLNYHGFTKSRPALKIIPPTTLIGALAYGLNLNKGEVYGEYSSAERIRKLFRNIHLKVDIPLLEYNDLSRVVSYKLREKSIITDAVATGKIYTVATGCLEIIYIFEDKVAEKLLGNDWLENLIYSAWSICRIGARESIVSVSKVEYGTIKYRKERTVETSFYFPLRASKRVNGVFSIFNVVDWTSTPIGDYTSAPKIPIVFPYDWDALESTKVQVELKDEYTALEAGDDIIVPWR